MSRPVSPNFATLTRLFVLTRQFWPHYGLLFFLSFLAAPLALLLPLPLSIIADYVIGTQPLGSGWLASLPDFIGGSRPQLFWFALLLLLVTTFLQQLDSYGNWLLQTYIGERAALDLKQKFLAHILRLPMSRHQSTHSADYLYRMQSDIPSLTYVPIQWIIMLNAIVSVAAMIFVMARLHFFIAMVAIAVIPFIYLLLKIYEPQARRGWLGFKEREASFLGHLKESLGAVLLIKGYGMERQRTEGAAGQGRVALHQQMVAIGIESLFGGGTALLLAIGSALVLYAGTQAVQSQELSLGQLILVMGYLAQLYKPLETLAKKTASLQAAFASADRVLAVFDAPLDSLYRAPLPAMAAKAQPGHISLRNVDFSHAHGEGEEEGRAIFRGLNLEIAPGTRLGIAGSSGAGKSTLLHLVRGLLKPQQGEVLIDGVPLDGLGAEALSRMISFVFQDSLLFSGTIRENITFGLHDMPRERIEKAARDAFAHEFIMRLPQGYETVVSEGGSNFSGGERQRLALARAFLRNSPILLLDEPTSAVDPESERAIVAALDKLIVGRTTLIVSHRPDSLERCTRVVALQDGRFVDVELVRT